MGVSPAVADGAVFDEPPPEHAMHATRASDRAKAGRMLKFEIVLGHTR
jgi:hypothetical protein